MLAHFLKGLHQQFVEGFFHALRAEREHLGYEYVAEAVNGESREAVRLAEDKPAAAEILRAHHGAAVVQRVAYPARIEIPVEPVVCIPGDHAYPYLGVVVYVSRAKVAALAAEYIDQSAVFVGYVNGGDFLSVYPWVTSAQGFFAFFGYGGFRVDSFHIIYPFHSCCSYSYYTTLPVISQEVWI